MKQLLFFISFLSITLLFSQAPGGVTNDLVLWVKSDDINLNTNDNVANWNDQSGLNNHASQVNAINQPTFNEVVQNYNSGVYFNENNQYLDIDNLLAANSMSIDIFAIGTNEVGTSGGDFHAMVFGQGENQWSSGGYCLCTMNNSQSEFGMWANNFFNSASTSWFGAQGMESRLLEGSYNGTDINFYFDAQLSAQTPYSGIIDVGGNGSGTTHLGGGDRTANSHKGFISEVIIYSSFLSNIDRNKINSYLTIKYGIRNVSRNGLANNLINSSGQSLFFGDSNDYWQGIIGIGRDDASGLHQKQSHLFYDETRLYLNTITTDNASNTGSFNNNEFIIMGNDTGILSPITNMPALELPPAPTAPLLPVVNRIEREWKITNTNYNNTFNIDIQLNDCVDISQININDIRLLVDDDGDFSNATIYETGDAGLSITLTGNYINILNIENTHIASNSTAYITIASTTLESLSLIIEENIIDDIVACDGDNDGFTDFLITISDLENQAIGSQSDIDSVTFYDQLNNELDFTNPYTNTTQDTQTITARITHNLGCYIETTFNLIVLQTSNVSPQNDILGCENYTLPQIIGTNLSGNEAYFTEQNGAGLSYFEDDVLNFNDFPTYPLTLYIYDSTIIGSITCYTETSFEITLNETPNINDQSDIFECETFTFPEIIGTSLTGNEAYYIQQDGQGAPFYEGDIINLGDFSNPLTIYIYDGLNLGATFCFSETNFELTLVNIPNIDNLATINNCEEFIFPEITGTNLTGNQSYYTESNGNGISYNEGDIITINDFSNYPITLYIYDTNISANCAVETSFELNLNSIPVIDPKNNITQCGSINLPLITGSNLTGNEAYYTEPNGLGDLFLDGDTITYTDFENYPITLYLYDEVPTETNDCLDEITIEITVYNATEFNLTEENLDINDIGTIIINMNDDTINYEYSIDDSEFQTNNIFLEIPEGIHTLTVQDENECVIQSITFENRIIYAIIPNFFSPNGDGVNDLWEVVDNLNVMEIITIFDRYGKVITQILPNSTGWNGYYNGKQILETDYWYVIDLTSGKQPIRGHFSLKK